MVDVTTANKIAIDLVESLKDKLTKEHGKFTGSLQSSIKYNLKFEGEDVIGIEISMNDYAEYLEYGTPNPTTQSEILPWVKRKIIPQIKLSGKNKVAVANKISENLAKHITKYGPRPFPFIRTTLKQDLPKIKRSVGL